MDAKVGKKMVWEEKSPTALDGEFYFEIFLVVPDGEREGGNIQNGKNGFSAESQDLTARGFDLR